MRTALLAFLAVLAGCGAAPAGSRPATSAVASYVEAVETDNPQLAYALLSDRVQSEVSYDAFVKRWREQSAERADAARAMKQGLKGELGLRERARVRYSDDKQLSLRREESTWRLDAPLLSSSHAPRPEDAIAALAKALSSKSYDQLIGILTTERRTTISRQVSQFVSSLAKHKADAVFPVGKNRAELLWEEGNTRFKVVLRRENQEWRIHDVHIRDAGSESDSP